MINFLSLSDCMGGVLEKVVKTIILLRIIQMVTFIYFKIAIVMTVVNS